VRHLSTVVTVAIVTIAVAWSPLLADEGAETLQVFEGGDFSSEAYISVGFLYGSGSRPDALGVPVSTARSHIASVTGNPAGLAFLERGGILIDVLPPIAASLTDYVDLDDPITEMVDSAIEGMASPSLNPVYPTVEARVGQEFQFTSGAAAWKIGPVVLGAAMEQPTSLSLGITDTGMEAFAETVKEEGETEIGIELRAMMDAVGDLSFKVGRTTFAAGSNITPMLGVGVSVSQYKGTGSVSGVVRGDGMISYGGEEYFFNDPDDPWNNALGYSAYGDYEGDGIGWTAGASWRLGRFIMLDAAYVQAPSLTMSGTLTTVEDMMPALSDDGLDLGDISPTEPTLTEHSVDVRDDELVLHLPSYVGAAVTLNAGFLMTTLEYRRYTSSIGFEFDDERAGVELTDAAGAQFDLGPLRLGGGVMRGTLIESVDEASAGEAPDEILIPLANVGTGFSIGGLNIDAAVLIPLQILKMSASFEF
jgi:hypothetical protein